MQVKAGLAGERTPDQPLTRNLEQARKGLVVDGTHTVMSMCHV